MKKLLSRCALFVFTCLNIQAHKANENIHLNMTATYKTGVFEKTNFAELILSKGLNTENFTNMLYQGENSAEKTNLEIYLIETDESQCIRYYGNWSNENQNRFHVELVDSTNPSCTDYSGGWIAHVRSGWGWCGTGDSVMTLVTGLEK